MALKSLELQGNPTGEQAKAELRRVCERRSPEVVLYM
jgi:hypothetical protein